jgi:hypothetical protein
MGAVRILLIALAGIHLSGCVLIDWIPIRYEPLPPDLPKSFSREKAAPAPTPKRSVRKPLPAQAASAKAESSAPPRRALRREVEPLSNRERKNKEYRRMDAEEDPEAQYVRGRIRLSGEGAERDYAGALELFLAAAERGHAGALRNLGHMYENGLGVPALPGEAAKWYSLGAGHGDVRAMAAFGYLLFTGVGVPQNTETGMRWLRMAGEEGDIDAQLLLGVIYDAGWSVAEDDAEALKWYALAADRGDHLARFMKACMHALGESVPADLVNAARDYRMAAAYGLTEAQAVLDNRHINLSGDDTGLRWKQGLIEKRPYARERLEKFSRMVATYKGAAVGDAEAFFGIGSFYWRGEGFEKDVEEAVRWWRLAARLGNEKARGFLARIDDFEKNGASGEGSPVTRVGNKQLPATLVYEIGLDLLNGKEDAGGIRPSAAWMNMLRRSREISSRP